MSDGVTLTPTHGVFVDGCGQGLSLAGPQALVPGGPMVTVVNVTGGAGGSGGYLHTQTPPALQWNVNHNLGRKPVVSVLTVGGVEIDAAITHVSLNQFLVDFNVPTAGQAVCA